MAELILSYPTIKNTYMCAFNESAYTVTSLKLLRHETSSKKKKIVKNYNGLNTPMYIGSTDSNLYVVFSGFLDIFNERTVSTVQMSFFGATAFYVNTDNLLYATGTHIHKLNLSNHKTVKYPHAISTRVNCLTQLNDSFIAIGDATGRLRIYDLSEQQEVLCQKLHNDSIQDVYLNGDTILTASRDKRITMSKFGITSSGFQLEVLKTSVEFGHFANCIVNYPAILVGLSSGELLALKSDTLEVFYKKAIHTDAIRRICHVCENKLATISDDGSLAVIDACFNKDETVGRSVVRKIIDKCPKIKCAQIVNDVLYAGVSDGTLFSIDLHTNETMTICKTHDIRTFWVISNDGIVVGNENGVVQYIRNDGAVLKLRRGTTPYSLCFDETTSTLFIGRRDGTIEKYSYSKNKFAFIEQNCVHRSVVGDIVVCAGKIYSCSDDQLVLIHDMSFNRLNAIRPSSDCTALNNLSIKNNNVYISSDNGNIYIFNDYAESQCYAISNHPIRAAEWYDEDLILGDRCGTLIRFDKNLQRSHLYQGNSRVIRVFEHNKKLFVVFEDAIISFERRDIEMMARGTVFIVHGHGDALKTSLQLLLTRAGVDSIVLHERPDEGRTIIDKLIEESDACRFAIALLTSDDLTDDGKYHARQNVYLEVGYFIGKLGKKHVLMLKDNSVDIPSDLQGVLYTPVISSNDAAWKIKVLKELSSAGFSINIDEVMKTI